MMKAKAKTIDEYLALLSNDKRAALKKLQRISSLKLQELKSASATEQVDRADNPL